ncbi:MAG: trypsin-like serine protease [Myxococcota bacterium]|nr:trypsin-like serine protease [Myxococcota bacterium]
MYSFWILSSAWGNPIVNGVEEEGFPSVLALGVEFNGYAFSACTGNLITPRIILTAAHCGDEYPLEAVLQLGSAFVATEVIDFEAKLSLEDAIIHPEYRKIGSLGPYDVGAYDFGLIQLAEDAPVAPTLFRSLPITEEHEGIAMKSVGFGITGHNRNDGGTKRSADLILSEVSSLFLEIQNGDNADDANICSGDSGGPMFHYDEEAEQYVQWAVHSWGDVYCLSESGSTRTDIVSEWIFDYIEEVHGSRDICEVNGLYEDGVCTELSACLQEDPECIVPEEPKGACSSAPIEMLGLSFLGGLVGLFRRQTKNSNTTGRET